SWAARPDTWGQMAFWSLKTSANDPNYTDCHFRFAGQYEDTETGLYYNRFRYYDKDTGQYISPDPIGLEGGFNPYGYVHCPVGWVDPFGLSGTSKLNAFQNANFPDPEKLTLHFKKHGGEFRATSEAEYLQIGRDIMEKGHKTEYYYKRLDQHRTGYVMYMGNTKQGLAKIAFVGVNPEGQIATIHTKSGKEIWKLLNGNKDEKVINLVPRDINGL
ncbi:TPA: RHS repeat-associated core domain-containing protein, partial [Morganella morganii]|nr:RHS repeat-associated core domain-containing protein [Morganella morganii]